MKNYRKFFLLIFLIIFSFHTIYGNIGFYGQSINSNIFNSGEDINVKFNLVNREDIVKSQINVIYELRRESDLSLFFEEVSEYDFAQNEVKQIENSLNIGEIPEGKYILTTQVRSGSGTPLGRVSNEIQINSGIKTDFKFDTLPHLRIFYAHNNMIRYEDSFSTVGRPTPRDENFEVRFSLDNKYANSQTFKYEFNLKNSYDYDNTIKIFENSTTVSGNSVKDIIEPISYNESGTYDLFVSVFNEEDILVANKEVRVVIIGDDGNILDVFNSQDTYEKDETVNLDVSVVGPADSLSVVKDSDLLLEILVDNEVLYYQTNKIDILPVNPVFYNFNFKAPQKLDFYTVRITLKNKNKVYDVVELNYEKLEPKLVISSSGAIYDPSLNMCLDDGICSEKERDIGTCADCIIEENNEKRKQIEAEKEEYKNETFTPIADTNEKDSVETRDYQLFFFISSVVIVLLYLIVINNKLRRK